MCNATFPHRLAAEETLARKQSLTTGPSSYAVVRDPQEDGLLRAIIEAPDDDAPRLVYADYLEEKGDPYGELVRCSVLAAQKNAPAAEGKEHKARVAELLKEHQWLPPFLDAKETRVRRGFVAEHQASRAPLPPGEELARLASHPLFSLMPRHVGYGSLGLFPFLARLPRLGAFGTIDWESYGFKGLPEGEDAAAIFARSPHLAGLLRLRLRQCGLTDDHLEALANNPALSLRVLNVGSDGGMEVSGNPFGNRGARALASSPYLRELEELDVSDSAMDDEGVAHLCAGKGLPKLKKLNLAGVCLSDRAYQTLARSPFTARLEELIISEGHYQGVGVSTDAGVRALAESPHLQNIKQLRIGLSVSDEVRSALRRRFGKRVVLY
jgi:uncharacterized protein (TIGR02996 family)